MENCFSCHFVIKDNEGLEGYSDDELLPIELEDELSTKDYEHGIMSHPYPRCKHGCWNVNHECEIKKIDPVSKNGFDHIKNLLINPRCNGLLFRKRETYMSIGAAKIIQKKEQEHEALKESINRADEAVQIARKGVRTSTIMVLFSLVVTAIIGIIGVTIELNKSDISEEVIVIPSLFLFLSVIVVSIVSLLIFNQD
jgi:hypothetical protein